MARLRLLGGRILVEPLPQLQQSEAGILYPQRYRDDDRRWRVIDVGPKVKEIKSGDFVLTQGIGEILHEFTDKVRIIEAKEVIAVWNQSTDGVRSMTVKHVTA